MNCKAAHILLKAAGHRFCQSCGESFFPYEDILHNMRDPLSRLVMCGHCGLSNAAHSSEDNYLYVCIGGAKTKFFPVNCTREINHKSLLESNLKFCYNCGLDLKEDKSELLSRS